MSIRGSRVAPRWVATAAVILLAAGCGGGDVPAEPAAAPVTEADEDPAPAGTDATASPDQTAEDAVEPALAAEAVADMAMPFAEGRDPFEPVRDTETPVETSDAGDGAVPAAPTAPAPTDAEPPAAPAPAPEPSAATCDADLAACLASLRLLDAGPGTAGPAIFQLGTTLYEVELGAGFADAFILLRIGDGCATVAHRDGVVERCVEPDSSLK